MLVLKVNHICHQYKTLEVLNNISFNANKGEFISLIGPLGCGKTTLLKILAGLIKPNKGAVYFQQKKIIKPVNGISLIFQKNNLLPWLNVFQNISLPLKINHVPEKKIKNLVKPVLKITGLNSFKKYLPYQLSGGLSQLTALSRAFISESDLLLLDEPFSSLDAISREKMNLKLTQLQKMLKKTIIMVTHDLDEAIFLSDKIYILSQKPAKLKKKVKINFKKPRKLSLKAKKQFFNLKNSLKKQISP
jgi:ABC-type nitrate/sulfonate/bicarbonate transport system ATPase subunit